MENLINIFYKDNVKFTKIDKVSPKEIYIISEDECIKIRWKHFTNFYLVCTECGQLYFMKQLTTHHLSKLYLCKSCNHKGSRNAMYGHKHSEEQKQLMSINRSGEKNSFYGKHHTQKTKDKISQANKGKLSGENNPMYGVNMFEYVGEEKAAKIKAKISVACTGEKNGFYGKHHTEETKQKLSEALKTSEAAKVVRNTKEYHQRLREGMLNSTALKISRNSEEYKAKKRLQWIKCVELGTKPKVSFNPKACKVLDLIAEENHSHIQHAMNGGEYCVKELGYYLDGYDIENNIAYEYDESYHFSKGKLREKDLARQKAIEEVLHCQFIRLKDEDYKDI